MPCFKPLTAYRARGSGVTFDRRQACGLPFSLPCGQCVGCRLERSRQWAVRCMHEASLYAENCFLTLTYDDEHLPDNGSLDKSEFQRFMKRLRRYDGRNRIRFFHCGEYGEKTLRPHYHAIIFNFDFGDKVFWKNSGSERLYVSAALSMLWPLGFSSIGSVTFDSAAYVARYVVKKVNGDAAESHYERVHSETGEIVQVEPEYATMSRRPGIGARWLEKYQSEVYPSDTVLVRGRLCKPPRFYDSQLPEEELSEIKRVRRKAQVRARWNNTDERLEVREQCARAKLSLKQRVVE